MLARSVNLHFPPTAKSAEVSSSLLTHRRTHNRKKRKVCAKQASIKSILQSLLIRTQPAFLNQQAIICNTSVGHQLL
jgi:hypothetical protein